MHAVLCEDKFGNQALWRSAPWLTLHRTLPWRKEIIQISEPTMSLGPIFSQGNTTFCWKKQPQISVTNVEINKDHSNEKIRGSLFSPCYIIKESITLREEIYIVSPSFSTHTYASSILSHNLLWHLLRAYSVISTVLRALHVLTYFTPTKTLWFKHKCNPHFTDELSEAQRVNIGSLDSSGLTPEPKYLLLS